MKTIWKFALRIVDEQIFDMPPAAILLSVHLQNGQPMLWALVDDAVRTVRRTILVRGTGQDCGEVGEFVGTFLLHGDGLVFHVFDGGQS